jgi:hypothetical protein
MMGDLDAEMSSAFVGVAQLSPALITPDFSLVLASTSGVPFAFILDV